MSSKKNILKVLFWLGIVIVLIALPLFIASMFCINDLPFVFHRRFIILSFLVTVPALLVLSCFKKYRKKSLKILLLVLFLHIYLTFISALVSYAACYSIPDELSGV